MTRRVSKDADPDTETFLPAVTFDGYPDGKTKVTFRAGVESIPVSKEFAQLMRDKGHVTTGALRVECEILPDGEIRRVRKYWTDEPLSEASATSSATVTNLDGSPVVRDADGSIHGEPMKSLTSKQRAALPPSVR